MSKVGQLYPEKREYHLIPLISLKTKILENFEFVFLKEDIHRFISSTELFLSDIRGLRYTGLKKVNFFVGHPVCESQLMDTCRFGVTGESYLTNGNLPNGWRRLIP